MVNNLPFPKYTKIVEKSTAKSIFDSLCSTYEGNQQVNEVKENLLVQQYKLFKMKDDEDIETMVSRFQTLVSIRHVLSECYTTTDRVKKILRSHPVRWRPKVNVIQEVKDLNTMGVETLIS